MRARKAATFKDMSAKSKYSKETQLILNDLCQDLRFSELKKQKLSQLLENSNASVKKSRLSRSKSLIDLRRSSSISKVSSEASLKLIPRLRSKEVILQRGDYQRDAFVPPAGQGISDRDKDALIFKMAYNRDMPEAPAGAKEALERRARRKLLLQDHKKDSHGDRFQELLNEIEDRRRFLNEMRKLGKSKAYEAQIRSEIGQKLTELELHEEATRKK